MMKHLLLYICCFATVIAANAQIKAVTETGEEVILNTNGTWQYANAVDKPVPRIPVPDTVTMYKDKNATFLVKGKSTKYGIWIEPKKWSFTGTSAIPGQEYQFTLKEHADDIMSMAIAEGVGMPYESLKDVALTNAKKVGPDAKITKEEVRKVNNRVVHLLQMELTANNIPFVFYGYYYTADNATIQFVTYTYKSMFDKHKQNMENLLNGFVIVD